MTGAGVEFIIENLESVLESLRKLENLPEYLADELDSWASEVLRDRLSGMGNYPSSRGNYDRTGALGGGWSALRTSPGVYSFQNSTDYAGYVVGDDQAWMHRGHWWKASERIDEQFAVLAKKLEDALARWPD